MPRPLPEKFRVQLLLPLIRTRILISIARNKRFLRACEKSVYPEYPAGQA